MWDDVICGRRRYRKVHKTENERRYAHAWHNTHFQILNLIPDHSLRHPYRSDIMFRPRADRHVRFDSQGDVSRGYGNWIAGWKISKKNKSCRKSNFEQLLFSHTFPNFTTNLHISEHCWTETSRYFTYNIDLCGIPVGYLREVLRVRLRIDHHIRFVGQGDVVTWIWKFNSTMIIREKKTQL